MKNSIITRFAYLLLTIVGCFLTIGMLRGTVQSFISFTGVANEIGFTFMLILGTICTGFMTINDK